MSETIKYEQKPEYHKAIEEAWPLVEQVQAIADKYGISNLVVSASSCYRGTSGVKASDFFLGDGYGACYEKCVYFKKIVYDEYEYEKVE